MRIVCIPPEFKSFFNRFRDLFSLRQFRYFSFYVYALIVLEPEQKSVVGISQAYVEPLCRSSLERLLCEVRWEFSKVIRRSRRQIIRVLSQKRKGKRRIQLVVDDTTLQKYGEQIFGAGWYKKNRALLPFLGIQMVIVGILEDGWLIPLDFHIYVREKDCGNIRLRFETKLCQAAKMLRNLKIPREFQVEVMFDTWYLNEQVTGVIKSRGWTWISRCAKNRSVLWEGEKRRQNLQKYVPAVKWESVRYETDRKNRAVVGHQRIGHLNGIGRIKIVISSFLADGSDRLAYFCTNDTRLPMVTVINRFETRWKVEVFFKEARKCFAFGRWQYRDVASIVHHLCLTLVAAMACAYLRIVEFEEGKGSPSESWGAFTRRLRKENQRHFLRFFLEKSKTNEYNDFEELCDSLGI
jgi:hypothetical protein